MPYIITTQPPTRTVWEGKRSSVVTVPPATSRAVATVQDARQRVFEIAEDACGIGRDIATQVEACRAVHETDPVSLPLPDGTVVKVEPVDNSSLGYRFGLLTVDHPQLWKTETLVEHFNAAQARNA